MKLMWIAIFTALSFNMAQAQGDFHLFDIDNKAGKYTPEIIEKAFEKNGFYIAADSAMNKPFKIQFKQTRFEVFNLLTVFHVEYSEALIKKHPTAGIFVPMGVGIYQAKGDDTLHVAILTAQAQEKIVGFKDEIFSKIEAVMIESLKKALPNAKMHYSKDAIKAEGPLVTRYEYEVDSEDWDDANDELQMVLEGGFNSRGFVVANYTDYNDMLTKEDTVESPFDFYETYSVCKLKVIYTVSKTRPEAAAFAPCTMMMYKLKGDNKIVIGFPGVYNWMSSAYVESEDAKKVLMKAQSDIEQILSEATE